MHLVLTVKGKLFFFFFLVEISRENCLFSLVLDKL